MEKSAAQLKHIHRMSRRMRHYQAHRNQMDEEKLNQNLNTLSYQYERTCTRLKASEKLEQQRKQVIGITIQHLAHEQRHTLTKARIRPPEQQKHLPPLAADFGEIRKRPSTPFKQTSTKTSCNLFSHDCQLYPCQPIYEYRSFMEEDHDRTLRQRNRNNVDSTIDPKISELQYLFHNITETKNQQHRRQLTLAIENQYHLAYRHASIKRTMTNLNEQSRLLRQRLTDKNRFTNIKGHEQELRQALQQHLMYTAKFCG